MSGPREPGWQSYEDPLRKGPPGYGEPQPTGYHGTAQQPAYPRGAPAVWSTSSAAQRYQALHGQPPGSVPPLAGSGRRLVARIVDGILVGVVTMLITFGWVGGGGWGTDFLVGLIAVVLYVVYEGAMLARDGQTIGKKLTRIRVAMLSDGSVPATGAAWERAAIYSVPNVVWFGFIFWLINVFWHLWDKPYRQCLHDMAAHTVVVRV